MQEVVDGMLQRMAPGYLLWDILAGLFLMLGLGFCYVQRHRCGRVGNRVFCVSHK